MNAMSIAHVLKLFCTKTLTKALMRDWKHGVDRTGAYCCTNKSCIFIYRSGAKY
jgi:hypothetical protein